MCPSPSPSSSPQHQPPHPVGIAPPPLLAGANGHQPPRHARSRASAPRSPRPQGGVWAARPGVAHAGVQGAWSAGALAPAVLPLRTIGAGGGACLLAPLRAVQVFARPRLAPMCPCPSPPRAPALPPPRTPRISAHLQIFKIHTRAMNVERDIRFELLARLCPNSTGADIRRWTGLSTACDGAFVFGADKSCCHAARPRSCGLSHTDAHPLLRMHAALPPRRECTRSARGARP